MNNRWIDFCYFVFPMNTPISSAAINSRVYMAPAWLLYIFMRIYYRILYRHPKDVLFFYIHLILLRFIHRAITYKRCIYIYISLLFLSPGITSSVCVAKVSLFSPLRLFFSLLLLSLWWITSNCQPARDGSRYSRAALYHRFLCPAYYSLPFSANLNISSCILRPWKKEGGGGL